MDEEMVRRIVREELEKCWTEKKTDPASIVAHNFGIPMDADYLLTRGIASDLAEINHNHGQSELIGKSFF